MSTPQCEASTTVSSPPVLSRARVSGSSAATVRLAAALLGLASLLVLDGWLAPFHAATPPSAAPVELSTALRLAGEDLSRRAETLGRMPEVARSLEGGGIAVNRASLFSAARNALDGAPPPSWIALTDADGTAHAWAVDVGAANGKFGGGKATVFASAFACRFDCGEDTVERTVTLKK